MREEFRKVLIVDDEFIIRQGIEFLIDWNGEGYALVGKYNNGIEALKLMENHPVDIVISDIVMPQMDGVELTKQIHHKYPDTRVIILSSYSDFEYVKNTFQQGAVDYILKPTLSPTTLLDTLHKVSLTLPIQKVKKNTDIAHQISRYVSGYKDALDNVELEKEFASHYFYLLAGNTRLHPKDDLDTFFNVELNSVLQDDFYCVFKYLEDFSVVLLNTNIEKDELYHKVETVLNQYFVNDEFYYFAFSRSFENIKDISEVCNTDIRYIFSRRFYCHDAFLVTTEMLPVTNEIDKFDFRAFDTLLHSNQLIRALDFILKYAQEAIKNYISETELKTTIGNVIYTMIAVFEDNDLNEDSVRHFKLNCFDLIESSSTNQQFLSRLSTILEDFKIIIDNYHLDSQDATIHKILLYMQEHYSEPLSLQDLVNEFGFSYSYLSSYFASQTNGTFIEHLNRIRIEKACELLENPSISISEVTEMVGYSDQSYFSKVFKKQTGITPREYRKR